MEPKQQETNKTVVNIQGGAGVQNIKVVDKNMGDVVKAATPTFRLIIVGAYIIGAFFAVVGIYLVFLGSSGTTEFSLLGQKFKSTNVGIAAVFIGAVTIIALVRRVLSSVDRSVGKD